ELHRLRGDFAKAEDAYRQAVKCGRRAEPGISLLRLAEGQVDAASASIRRALNEASDSRIRARLLDACVEISIATNDLPLARTAADELAQIATVMESPYLRAMATHCDGAVHLAEGDAQTALVALREAAAGWRTLEVPYAEARTRVVIARACRTLGDGDASAMELDAARETFQTLGAGPDVAAVKKRRSVRARPGGLTDREVEVLSLVATGRTNRAIADELGLSEKTVGRHVSNIFMKLGLSTRAAATAYAYQQKLVQR
ncbi:MAG: transcriptional regulator, LuxR family, partial [Geminicoccaceae bacterium]|nr:transcriptional regulator, LuxR family [Geminicoccaceae bacterium]